MSKPPFKPINRRAFVDSDFAVLWLLLALGTMGLFFLVEQLVYEIVDVVRYERWRRLP